MNWRETKLWAGRTLRELLRERKEAVDPEWGLCLGPNVGGEWCASVAIKVIPVRLPIILGKL